MLLKSSSLYYKKHPQSFTELLPHIEIVTLTVVAKGPWQSVSLRYTYLNCTLVEMFVDERIVTLFKRNAHHTLTYWSVFFSFGLCIAFLGPTILDLQCQTKSTLSQITWVFFAQQFCLLIGSSIGGIFKRT